MTITSSNELYFLDASLDEFFEKVWDRGLQKFASDTSSKKDNGILKYGELQLTITKGLQSNIRTLSIGTFEDNVTLELSLNMPIIDPEYTCVGEIAIITDLIYEAIDLWAAGFFTLKDS